MMCGNSYASEISKEYIDSAFEEISEQIGVPQDFLRAICWVESNHKPHAYNHGDATANNHAFGICQVLYSTATSLGFSDNRCKKSFLTTPDKDKNYKNCKLFGPRTSIMYAAIYFKSRIDKYDGNYWKAIASYNTGRYKVCKDGWLYNKGQKWKRCIIGGPVNKYYVDRVEEAWLNGK